MSSKFSDALLRESADTIVNRLYEKAGDPCTRCGFRFNNKEKKASHLDWHFRKNQEEKKRLRKASSRDWFSPLGEWKEYKGLEEISPASSFFGSDESPPPSPPREVSKVMKDESQVSCEVCNEKFDTQYDSDEEEWVYTGTLRSTDDNKIYHVTCFSQDDDHGDDLSDSSSLGKRHGLTHEDDTDSPHKMARINLPLSQ